MEYFHSLKKIKFARDDEARAKIPGRFGANLAGVSRALVGWPQVLPSFHFRASAVAGHWLLRRRASKKPNNLKSNWISGVAKMGQNFLVFLLIYSQLV